MRLPCRLMHEYRCVVSEEKNYIFVIFQQNVKTQFFSQGKPNKLSIIHPANIQQYLERDKEMLERLQISSENSVKECCQFVCFLFSFTVNVLYIISWVFPIKMNLTVAQQEQMVMKLFSGLIVCPSPQESFGICQHYFETVYPVLNVLKRE